MRSCSYFRFWPSLSLGLGIVGWLPVVPHPLGLQAFLLTWGWLVFLAGSRAPQNPSLILSEDGVYADAEPPAHSGYRYCGYGLPPCKGHTYELWFETLLMDFRLVLV
jgi:hypothetical protein